MQTLSGISLVDVQAVYDGPEGDLWIGTSLGLETIAESVETEEIAKKLTSIGVKLGQGFHLCPPRPLDALFERAAAV